MAAMEPGMEKAVKAETARQLASCFPNPNIFVQLFKLSTCA